MVGADLPGAADGFMVSFAAGSRIAGYRLEEQIGRGGVAVVFRARDQQPGPLVALKILAPALAGDAVFQRRFISGSRAAAAIDDPHIVPVFAAGEADGVLFIAMRYVPGGDARALLSRFADALRGAFGFQPYDSGPDVMPAAPPSPAGLQTTSFVPPPALQTEMSKQWYPYLGLSVSVAREPPPPQWLLLGAGNAHITAPHRIPAGEFSQTVTFSFRIGDNGYYWDWNSCSKDTESACPATTAAETSAYPTQPATSVSPTPPGRQAYSSPANWADSRTDGMHHRSFGPGKPNSGFMIHACCSR